MLFTIVFCSTFVFGNSAFVGTLSKCGMSDNNCQKNLVQAVLRDIGKTGVKELGIPPIDPLQLKNVSISILGAMDISLEDGIVKGVKDCNVDDILSDIPNGQYTIQLTCDITIKGHYKAHSASPLIKSLLGGEFVRGDGFGKVKVEQITTKIHFKPYVFKNKDGELFISSDIEDTNVEFDIKGNLRFAANNIYLGDEDVSAPVLELLNQSAKGLAPFFGKPIIDKSLEIVYSLGNKFFKFVPARFYIKEDLTPFVTRIKYLDHKRYR